MNELAATLLQILAIVIASRAMGRLLRHCGQPPVIGELAAGIALGPSLFGRIAPDAFAMLFPPSSLGTLLALSQVGLIFFMFLVGLEFAPAAFGERKHTVIVISHVSILVPFLMGSALAFYLYPRVAGAGVPFRGFVLFVGTTMSITAFPVLARILEDRHLLRTRMGNTAIACAAVDDVTAWCILAVVVMIVRAGDLAMLGLRAVLLAAYVTVMIAFVRPLLQRLYAKSKRFGEECFVGMLLFVLASACATELLGMHALFGAFLAGAVVPREAPLLQSLVTQTRGLTSVIFLPLFFAVTGLRTDVALLVDPALWLAGALVLLVAVTGKWGGAMFSARAVGFTWREATAIGALMNTRGLMEMVVLNIGLEIGVVSPKLFPMIVLMALATTAMTSPLLDRIVPRARAVDAPDAFGAVA